MTAREEGAREEGRIPMRRLALVPVVLVIALFVALPAAASPSIVTFELSSEQCSNLADGTTLEGSGIEKVIEIVRTNASGVTTIINATHTHGTSTDQDGNVYVFDYSNEFRVSNTVDDPETFTGLMTDHFSNSGPGPAKLNNGFVANVTFGPGEFDFAVDPISSFGDPLSFPDGAAHCDPL
jgi:hypothetical protein